MTLDDLAKVAQISFYLIGSIVAIMTYRSAKRGLLNTVNTEYHKRVIDRLQKLADELLAEFDPASPHFWAGKGIIDDAVKEINRDFLHTRNMPGGPHLTGIPSTEIERRLDRSIRLLKADPFIPVEVRDVVLKVLRHRYDVTFEATMKHLAEYQEALKRGEHTETLDRNSGWLHNRVLTDLYAKGAGIAQVEGEVDRILYAIQNYFDSFNPLSRAAKERLRIRVTVRDQEREAQLSEPLV
jgi:hypothetical protein